MADAKSVSPFKVVIAIKSSLLKDQPKVIARLTVTNVSRKRERIEKYRIGADGPEQTPTNNFFELRAGGESIAYAGEMAKRGPTPPDGYVWIEPGKSAEGSFDLSHVYPWKKNTEYEIWYAIYGSSPSVKFKL